MADSNVNGDSDLAQRDHTSADDKPRFSLLWLMGLVTSFAVFFAFCGIFWRAVNAPIIDTSTRVEIMGLAAAVESYKMHHGYYPPSRAEDMENHIHLLFPRCAASEVIPELDPAEALVFFLSDFARDHRHPISSKGLRTPLFDFDRTRLVDLDGDGWCEYHPRLPGSGKAPYVYFTAPYGDQSYSDPAFKGAARPRPNVPKEFQIISAGRDADFGTSFDKRDRAARDNVTSCDEFDDDGP